MKRIQIPEEGRVPAKEVKNWRIEGEKKISSRKELKMLSNNFEIERLTAQKGLWDLSKRQNNEGKRRNAK